MARGRRPIESDGRVRSALATLGWRPRHDAESWLRDHVRETIARWISDARTKGACDIKSPADVLTLVAERLRVHVVHVESDAELHDRVREYCKRGELAIKQIADELAGDVEAGIVRLKSAEDWERPLVALVDARGHRGASRFFSACHEVAHPFLDPQLSFGFRCRTGTDPLERAVDLIAGEIAFYAPLAGPILRAHAGRDLTFSAAERFWTDAGPTSSRSAAMVAAVRLWNRPAVFLTATMRCARHGRDGGIPALRVDHAMPNDAAREEGLFILPFRVPVSSPIHRAFQDPFRQVHEGVEQLGLWTSSDGGTLPARALKVGAKRVGERVFAILRA